MAVIVDAGISHSSGERSSTTPSTSSRQTIGNATAVRRPAAVAASLRKSSRSPVRVRASTGRWRCQATPGKSMPYGGRSFLVAVSNSLCCSGLATQTTCALEQGMSRDPHHPGRTSERLTQRPQQPRRAVLERRPPGKRRRDRLARGEFALETALLVDVPEDRRQPQTLVVAKHFLARRRAQMPTPPVRVNNAKREQRHGNVVEQ